MKRYYIEDAKCGITNGGIACGPVPGNVVTTIRFKEDTKSRWLSLVEVEGLANYYLSDKDIYEDLVKEDIEDEEFTEYLDEHYIDEFNDVALGADYEETFESIEEDPENPAVPVIRFLIALTRCKMEDVEELIKMATGKYADELDIPEIDVEQEYLEDYEEDDEDED